jgi:hypothetical protein
MKTTNHELYESHGNILEIMDHEHESHAHKGHNIEKKNMNINVNKHECFKKSSHRMSENMNHHGA